MPKSNQACQSKTNHSPTMITMSFCSFLKKGSSKANLDIIIKSICCHIEHWMAWSPAMGQFIAILHCLWVAGNPCFCRQHGGHLGTPNHRWTKPLIIHVGKWWNNAVHQRNGLSTARSQKHHFWQHVSVLGPHSSSPQVPQMDSMPTNGALNSKSKVYEQNINLLLGSKMVTANILCAKCWNSHEPNQWLWSTQHTISTCVLA